MAWEIGLNFQPHRNFESAAKFNGKTLSMPKNQIFFYKAIAYCISTFFRVFAGDPNRTRNEPEKDARFSSSVGH
jgi:hypothetical protein